MKNLQKRVMITSVTPTAGGVVTMTEFIVKLLKKHGFKPVIAFYEPYSYFPELSVPIYKLLKMKPPSKITRVAYENCEAYAVGAWLPELEFTHYLATNLWKEIMDSCFAHVMVSGNILASTPYWQTKRSFLAWVATDWKSDRENRVKKNFSWPRKLLDNCVNGPIIKWMEKRLICTGKILTLSQYTSKSFNTLNKSKEIFPVLTIPIDSDKFEFCTKNTIVGRIGFTGRFDDPRKNIGLLFEAIFLIKKMGVKISVYLIGSEQTEEIKQQLIKLNLELDVNILPQLPRPELIPYLQTFDVFVLPSYQEGLCISALEAMSCGVPVISTTCGGPEEFVINDVTGELVNFEANNMANAIAKIIQNRALRSILSEGARKLVVDKYSQKFAEQVFMTAFNETFTNLKEH